MGEPLPKYWRRKADNGDETADVFELVMLAETHPGEDGVYVLANRMGGLNKAVPFDRLYEDYEFLPKRNWTDLKQITYDAGYDAGVKAGKREIRRVLQVFLGIEEPTPEERAYNLSLPTPEAISQD